MDLHRSTFGASFTSNNRLRLVWRGRPASAFYRYAGLGHRQLPGGTFNGIRGWKTNVANTRWTYVDPLGTIGGITKVTIWDRSVRQPGLLTWAVFGKSAATVTLPDVSTARAQVVLGAATECAQVQWGGPTASRPRCRGSAGQLKCR